MSRPARRGGRRTQVPRRPRPRPRRSPARGGAGSRYLSAALRLGGGALFLAIALTYFSPLRRAALQAGEAVAHAAHSGSAAAAREGEVVLQSLRYGISFELAAAIDRAARAEGIDPDLGFRLVRVESRFKERAVSPAGALGLTQLMPATAGELKPGITREEIFHRDTNLRLGFRYLRWLIELYDGNLPEALHAYNRGPGRVAQIRAAGGDPANGYADLVLRGGRTPFPYRGSGLAEGLPAFPDLF